MPQVPLTCLTSVYGVFRARVMAAHLEVEGFDVVLRGALNSPYGLTVGDLARIDVYVPDDQVDDAKLMLLATEIDEVDEILDDDRPPIRDPYVPRILVAAAIGLILLAGPILHILHWY